MAIKYFLVLVSAAGFMPVPALATRPLRVHYSKLNTKLTAVQEEIVNAHNTLRRKVVPPAKNMLKMNWNEDAAQNAQTLSKYCYLTESSPLERRVNHTFCGENSHLRSYPVSWSYVIELWYNESKHFRYGKQIATDDDIITYHYTQVVWATSYLIGCGVSLCQRERSFQYSYICHYCHEGNDPDTINVPYKSGIPCGDCPKDCDDKLCTNPCFYYDEHNKCEEQVKALGCKHQSVKQFCKATCLCDTEIK